MRRSAERLLTRDSVAWPITKTRTTRAVSSELDAWSPPGPSHRRVTTNEQILWSPSKTPSGYLICYRKIAARRTTCATYYGPSAAKAARFVLNCNQKQIPLIFVQDVSGFMVGTRAEQGGIIKDGAKLVNAVSNSQVPKITLVVGNSYGAGNYALCGRAFGPRFMIAWPSARIAVMGGDQAAETILSIEKRKQGGEISDEEEREILGRIRSTYESTLSPYYAAARLWVDAIIDPRRTRGVLDQLLGVACRHDPEERMRVGVFQV